MRELALIGAAFGLFIYALNSRAAAMPSSFAPGEYYPDEYFPTETGGDFYYDEADDFAPDGLDYFADDPIIDYSDYFADDPIIDYPVDPIPQAPEPQQVVVSDFDFDWLERLNEMGSVDPDPVGNPDANVAAFLATIRTGEVGTTGAAGYRKLYGGGSFSDMSDHPANGNWGGVKLPSNYCGPAGFGAGCVSTAAGAYQFLKGTWNTVAARLGLPDFSPASQDAAAIELIRGRGALADVRAGRFESALRKVGAEWASLPGSPYGQPTLTLARATQVYENNGGSYA